MVVCPNLKVCQRFMPLHLMWIKRTIKKDKRSHKCPRFSVERLLSANILHAPALLTIQDRIGEKRKTQFVFKNKEMLGRYICER